MIKPELTQMEKILTVMLREGPMKQKWFLPQDFMREGLGDLFVGYEASARLSELARDYPALIESKREGKYMARRVRWESIEEAIPTLNQNVVAFIRKIQAKYGSK